MGFTRTEIRVEVTGAEEGARALENVAAADTRMTAATMAASQALQQQEKAVKQTTNAFGSAVQEIRRYDHATGLVTVEHVKVAKSAQEAGRGIEKMRDEANKAAQPMNVMGAAASVASKGVGLIMKAAYLLPGFGFAGILLKLGDAMSWVKEQFVEGAKQTEIQTAALAEWTRVVDEAAKAVRELGRAQSEAGRSRIGGALGIDPRALSGESRIQGAQLEAERAKLDERQKALDAQAGEIAAAERSVRERAARLSDAVAGGIILPGRYGMAAALEAEAKAIGERRRLLVSEAEKLRGAEISLESKVEGLRRAAGLADSQKAGGARGAGRSVAMPKAEGPNVNGVWSLGPAAGEDLSPQGIQNVISLDAWRAKRAAEAKAIADQEMADFRLVTDQRNAMMTAHMQAGDGGSPAIPSLYAMLTATEEEKAAFDQQMADASAGMRAIYAETQRLANDGVNMLTGLGRGLSMAAAASLLTGKSFKQAANDLLKSLAVQAAGEAIWQTAQGLGALALAAFGNPAAAASAAAHFKSAAVFTGLAVAFGGGAMATGGLGAGGGGASASRGSGAGMASAAGTNPYRSEASAPRPIHIHIGSETVTRVVDGERRREARRDGISAREAA